MEAVRSQFNETMAFKVMTGWTSFLALVGGYGLVSYIMAWTRNDECMSFYFRIFFGFYFVVFFVLDILFMGIFVLFII